MSQRRACDQSPELMRKQGQGMIATGPHWRWHVKETQRPQCPSELCLDVQAEGPGDTVTVVWRCQARVDHHREGEQRHGCTERRPDGRDVRLEWDNPEQGAPRWTGRP
jgi:hypothetical protein